MNSWKNYHKNCKCTSEEYDTKCRMANCLCHSCRKQNGPEKCEWVRDRLAEDKPININEHDIEDINAILYSPPSLLISPSEAVLSLSEENVEELLHINEFHAGESQLLKRPIFNCAIDTEKVKSKVKRIRDRKGEDEALNYWISIWKKFSS